jgi:hypothetical protein
MRYSTLAVMTSPKVSLPKLKGLKSYLKVWHKLSVDQRVTLMLLIVLLFILPLGVILVLSPKIPFFSRAGYPATSTNSPPRIRTKSLPKGVLGEKYKAVVLGYDDDVNDRLEMKIDDLPEGLSQRECVTRRSSARVFISCKITGVPRKDGLFGVHVVLTDNKKGRDVETIKFLVVRGRISPLPTGDTIPSPPPVR